MAREPIWKTAPNTALKAIRPVVHYGFVPMIIYLGLQQEPELSLLHVIFPLFAPPEPPQM